MRDLSETASSALIDPDLLRSFCKQVRFEPGAVLRQRGQHYRHMYLIAVGHVDVALEVGGRARLLVSGPGSSIGEIGFLRGSPATATVTARTAIDALVIDDPTLACLEQQEPALAAQLWRQLAETAEENISNNLTSASTAMAYDDAPAIEIYLCRNDEMLENARRLRYEIYCRELGRQSPYADHERKIITDELDDFGNTFVAVEAGETIATLRINISSDRGLGVLEELYGMKKSAFHPHATAICTKFIVKKSKRGGPASMKLISALARYGLQNDLKECYIDCIPALLPYYKAIGFAITGEKFFHRENGPSHPMMIDLTRHGGRLANGIRAPEYLMLFMKAKAIELFDSIRRCKPFARVHKRSRS